VAVPLLTLAQDLETGDLAAGPLGLRMAVGAEAVAVLATNALRQRPGDDPVQPWRGIPYETLLGRAPSTTAIEGLLRRRLGEVSRVTTVASLRATVDGEVVRIEVVARTGEVEASFSAAVT